MKEAECPVDFREKVIAKFSEAGFEIDPEIAFYFSFDAAFVGFCRQFNNTFAVYDYEKCIKILMDRDQMDYEGAAEYMEFNVIGGWHGPDTPGILVMTPED